MKKLPVLAFVLSPVSILSVYSQGVIMTFTTGISPQQTPASNFIFVNRSTPRDEFTFDLAQVKASYFVGAGIRYDLKPFFLAAEGQYNKREYVYKISYTFPGFHRSEQSQLLSESMNIINVPLTLGVDLGAVDVTSGFLPQIILSHSTDLNDLPGYNQNLNWLRLGWQTGVAAHVGAMRLGISMQMDFNNYADHAYVGEQSLALQGRPTRLLANFSYNFN
jgi:hypothetical protein